MMLRGIAVCLGCAAALASPPVGEVIELGGGFVVIEEGPPAHACVSGALDRDSCPPDALCVAGRCQPMITCSADAICRGARGGFCNADASLPAKASICLPRRCRDEGDCHGARCLRRDAPQLGFCQGAER